MKIEDEEIDKLFREARQPEIPAFNESFWNEIEPLLPVRKRRRKVAAWWFALAVGLIGFGALVTWPFIKSGTADLPSGNTTVQTPGSVPAKQGASAETTTPRLSDEPSANPETALNESGNNQQPTTLSATGNTRPAVSGKKFIRHQSGKTGTIPLSATSVLPVMKPGIQSIGDGTDSPENRSTEQPKPGDPGVRSSLLTASLPFRVPTFMSAEKALLKKKNEVPEPPKAKRYYLQVSAGVGQSAQRQVASHSDFLHYYAVGAGLFKHLDGMILTFGAQARVDFSKNIILNGKSSNAQYVYKTSYNQLYSIETPVSMGFRLGKNTFALVLTPGFQTNFSGKRVEYDQQSTEVRSEHVAGKVTYARTLTLETGVNYQRSLSRDWYLGLAFNVDAIRPFYSNYEGVQRMLPMNGQVFVRRLF